MKVAKKAVAASGRVRPKAKAKRKSAQPRRRKDNRRTVESLLPENRREEKSSCGVSPPQIPQCSASEPVKAPPPAWTRRGYNTLVEEVAKQMYECIEAGRDQRTKNGPKPRGCDVWDNMRLIGWRLEDVTQTNSEEAFTYKPEMK